MSNEPSRGGSASTSPRPDRAPAEKARLNRLAGLPVLLLLVAIVSCRLAGLHAVYEHAVLRLVLSSAFYTLVALGTLLLVARSFLASGAAGLLLLECGVLLWSLAGTVGDLFFRGNANVDITIFNVGIFLAALCHLSGAVLTARPWQPLAARHRWLALGITLALAGLGLVTWAALTDRLPVFFIQGQGGTPVRYGVLIAAIAMFLLSAVLLRAGGRERMTFVSWYSFALLAMSVGLFGIMIQTALGSLVNWLSRAAQWLGGVYLLAAAVTSVREAGAWSLPIEATDLDEPASLWDDRLLRLLTPRRFWSLPPAWRYGVAVVVVAASTALRSALIPWMGTTAAFNLAFAADVGITLLVGLGPGLLSVPLGLLGAELFVVRPAPPAVTGEMVLRLSVSMAVGALIVCVVHAIRAAQVATRRSEARFSGFAAATFEGIVESEAGRIVDCNDQFAQMTGRTPSELKGMLLTELVAPEERARGTATIRENQDSVGEYTAVRADGVRFVVETRGRASAPGRPRRFTAVRDITARKEMESERARSARQHQLALDAACMGWWHYDPVAKIATWDDRYREIFGVSGSTRPIDDLLAQIIHPDDLPGLWTKVEAALNPAAPTPFAAEYRINRPDGAMRWIEAHGLASFEGEGDQRHATNLVGTVADITDRKRATEALARERENLQRIFDVVNVGLLLVGEDGAVAQINNTLTRWVGKDLSHSLGMQPGDVIGCVHARSNPRGCGHSGACRSCPIRNTLESVLRSGRPVHGVEAEASFSIGDRTADLWLDVSADPLTLDGRKYVLLAMNDITGRKQAEDALRRLNAELEQRVADRTTELVAAGREVQAERQRFLDVLDTLPVAIDIIRPDHRIEWANRAYREALGDHQGSLCFASQFGRDTPCEECEVFTPLKTGRSHKWERTLPDGRTFEVYNFPFADGNGSPMVLEMDLDITEQRQAEEALRRISAYNRSLIEASVDPLVTIGPDGTITDANVATETVTGCSRDGLIGTDFSDYFTEPARARAGYQQAFREGIVRNYPLEIQRRDGRLTSVLYNARVYRDQTGQVAGVFAAARDVTERLQAERALAERTALIEHQADQLRALANELARTEQRERHRLAKILHDNIQQLLVAAQIQLNLIARADRKTVQTTVLGMSGILAETLEASRSLTVELCPPVLHQSGLAAALTWLAARLAEKQFFKVHLRVDNDAEPASPDERAFLFEATREILLNAAKHSGTREAHVTMMRTGDGCCRIIAEDQGRGFDPASVKPGPTGGFGLFSIQQRLLYMGGTLEMESSPGQGTRAVLTIPIRRHAASPGAPAPASPAGVEASAAFRVKAQKISVLLVDDHKLMRQGLSSLLQFENDIDIVAEAENGLLALEAARQHKPDVVIMDVNMPVMNGIEATRLLMKERPGTRVIALSMHLDQDAASEMREAGAVAYLTKGGPSEDLVAAIRACMSVTAADSAAGLPSVATRPPRRPGR
jgi:PAS domain S-box-containing protein